jgi:hypothetical protein
MASCSSNISANRRILQAKLDPEKGISIRTLCCARCKAQSANSVCPRKGAPYGLVYTFGDTKDQSPGRAERREEVNEKYADAINNFRRTQLAMEIVCGTAIGTRFREIDNIFARTLHGARRGDFDEIWNELAPALLAAKRELGETIRGQLDFDPQLGGGQISLTLHIAPLPNEDRV